MPAKFAHYLKVSAVYHIIIIFIFLLVCFISAFAGKPVNLQMVFNAWDGEHYLYIAQHGYVSTGDQANYIAFFPLYPLLIGMVGFVVRSYLVAALLISVIGSLFGHALLGYWLLNMFKDEKRVLRTMLLLFLSPVSIYFFHVYTEGLFLFCTALFLVLLQKKHWHYAAFAGFLASTTRLVGVFTLIPYAFAVWVHVKDRLERWCYLIYGALIAMGILAYFVINFAVFDNAFKYQEVLKENWSKEILNPIERYVSELVPFVEGHFPDVETKIHDVVLTLAFPILLIIFVLTSKFKLQVEEWGLLLWGLTQWLVVAAQSYWLSNARYILLIMPLYIVLERLTKKHAVLFYLLCVISAAFMLKNMYVFSLAGWIY